MCSDRLKVLFRYRRYRTGTLKQWSVPKPVEPELFCIVGARISNFGSGAGPNLHNPERSGPCGQRDFQVPEARTHRTRATEGGNNIVSQGDLKNRTSAKFL